MEGAEHCGWPLTLAEWVFLVSGGLTVAYMTKLFVAVFVEKHPDRQAEFDAQKQYLSRPAALALGLSAAVIPALGLTATVSMDKIADLAVDFLHAGPLTHEVRYLSLENLKGAAISIAIGAAVYLLAVRRRMRKNGDYVNCWPEKLDLEELVYRPLLLKLLPAVFGWVSALFGENRLFEPAARSIFAVMRTLSHAASDSLDALVLVLRRTLLRQSPEPETDKVRRSAAYRMGTELDRLGLGRAPAGEGDRGRWVYRVVRTWRETGRLLRTTLSFGLLMLILGLAGGLIWLLWRL